MDAAEMMDKLRELLPNLDLEFYRAYVIIAPDDHNLACVVWKDKDNKINVARIEKSP